MHQHGSIVRWDSTRGFGFIRSASTQTDVFFHVRDFHGAPEPVLRMAVEYQEIHVGGKGPRAMAVRARGAAQPAGSHPAQPGNPGKGSPALRNAGQGTRTRSSHRPAAAPRSAHRSRSTAPTAPSPARAAGTALFQLLVLCWLALLGWGLWSGQLPLWTAGAFVGLNLLTVWTYTSDKRAARAGTQRASENQLHLLSLLGGWPAAWLAQQNLRHKTSKASFRAVYWLTIALHCCALALWLWRSPFAISI